MEKLKEKVCKVCGKTKPLTDFYTRDNGRYYRNECKECCIQRVKENKPKGIKKGVVFFDIHYPKQNKKVMEIGYDFLNDFQPDIFIFGGDSLDLGCISSFNKSKPKLTEGKRLSRDYKGFQVDILDKLDTILPEECKRYFIIGNHEMRSCWLGECNPTLTGLVEVENNLDLSKYKVIPFNQYIKLGKMIILHGNYTTKYHSYKNLETYNTNVFTGHLHKFQAFSKKNPIDGKPKISFSIPCMCNLNPEYLQGKPNDWINGFLYFYIYPNGDFNFYVPIIMGNNVIIEGKLYSN